MRNVELRQDLTNRVSKQTVFYPFNAGVFGEAGSGKTAVLKGLVNDLIVQNTKIFVFDICGAWRYLNGEKISFNRKDVILTEQKIFENSITLFEFEEIKEDYQLLKISLENLLIQIKNQMSKSSEKFVIVIDDLWLLNNVIDSSLEKMMKEASQYNGSLVFSSMRESDVPSVILENCNRKIVIFN